MEPIKQSARRGGQRVEPVRGPALGYQRSGPTGNEQPPVGWGHVVSTATVGVGVEFFDSAADDLFSFAAHRRSGIRVVAADQGLPADLTVLDGPMRGPCRLVHRTDESLRQGLVLGTLEGNRAVAEHHCHLELEPDSTAVAVTVRTMWLPRSVSVFPGGGGREARAHRQMAERLARALRPGGSVPGRR